MNIKEKNEVLKGKLLEWYINADAIVYFCS
jgi:hypothetical protein